MNQMQHDFEGGPVAKDYGELLGTPFKVFLSNGVTTTFDEVSGSPSVEIVDLPGLIARTVQARALHPRKLSGDDLRYIRSALCLRSNAVAETLDVSAEHYSRCEAGTKTLSSSAEKLYRMKVFLLAACKHEVFQDLLRSEPISNDAVELNSEKSDEGKKALLTFQKAFIEMKIEHIYPAGDELTFSFSRRSRTVDECPDCPDDDGKWQREPERDAA